MTKKLIRVAAFLILANLPFWLMATHFFVFQPVFNADVFIALIAWALSPVLGGILLVLVWSIAALQSLSLIFHFSPLEFLKTIKFAENLVWRDYISWSSVAGLMVVMAFSSVVWLTHRKWKPQLRHALLCTAIVLLADIANGSGAASIFGNDRFVTPFNIAGSPTTYMLMTSRNAEKNAIKPLIELGGDDNIFAVEWAKEHQGNILVIIVEALGVHKTQALQDWLYSRIADERMRQRWNITQERRNFYGATTSGELRVLCGLDGHYGRLTPDSTSNCLPNLLKPLNYETFGLHGFTGKMFDRTNWWPLIGIENAFFGESMPPDTPHCGGVFRGVCDDAMAQQAKTLLQGQRRLVYLLTLNTHLPLQNHPVQDDLREICDKQQVDENTCQLTAQLGTLFDDIRNLLVDMKDPPFVIMAGDHSPPFSTQRAREQYSSTEVPHYVMVPR